MLPNLLANRKSVGTILSQAVRLIFRTQSESEVCHEYQDDCSRNRAGNRSSIDSDRHHPVGRYRSAGAGAHAAAVAERAVIDEGGEAASYPIELPLNSQLCPF